MLNSTQTKRRPPYAWGQVLRYVNARPSESNWRQYLAGVPVGQAVPAGPVYGFGSLAELEPVLAEFRDFLSRLVSFPTIRAAEHSDVKSIINERASGRFKGWLWVRGTGRLFARIEPDQLSFEQSLYAQLAVAMTVQPFTVIKRCKNCERFFYEPIRKRARLCSRSCREAEAAARVQRYRLAHPERYREYQRKLMKQRRRRGK